MQTNPGIPDYERKSRLVRYAIVDKKKILTADSNCTDSPVDIQVVHIRFLAYRDFEIVYKDAYVRSKSGLRVRIYRESVRHFMAASYPLRLEHTRYSDPVGIARVRYKRLPLAKLNSLYLEEKQNLHYVHISGGNINIADHKSSLGFNRTLSILTYALLSALRLGIWLTRPAHCLYVKTAALHKRLLTFARKAYDREWA